MYLFGWIPVQHIDLSTLHEVTDFDELSDELSFDFVDKNGNEAKYVEIMDTDVDNLLEQIDNGTLEVSDPCAYWLVESLFTTMPTEL